MTDQFFSCPKALQRLHTGPLAVHIDSFAKVLCEQGYAINTAKTKILPVADLSRWIERKQLQISGLDEQKISEFLKYRAIHYSLERFSQSLAWCWYYSCPCPGCRQ